MNMGPGKHFGSWYLLPAGACSQIAIATDDVTVRNRSVITLPGKGCEKVRLQQYLFKNPHLWSPEREWILDANPTLGADQVPADAPSGHPIIVKLIEETVVHVKVGVDGILATHVQKIGERRTKLTEQSNHWKFANDARSIAPGIFAKITSFLGSTPWHITWTRLTFGKDARTGDLLIVGAIADPDNASIERDRSQVHFDRSLIKAHCQHQKRLTANSATTRTLLRQYETFFKLGM